MKEFTSRAVIGRLVPFPSGALNQPTPSECRESPHHSRKRTIFNLLFNLFATLSFELDYDLVALNRNVLFQQGRCSTATVFPGILIIARPQERHIDQPDHRRDLPSSA